MQDLEGRTAVITGAASGIGRALALACARAGVRVIATDVERDPLDRLAAELAAGGGPPARTERLDVRDHAAVEALAARCFAGAAGVELLFNNAGVMMTRPLWEHSDPEWRWLIDVNLTGIMNGIRAFVPRMLARGVPAHVVNTGSMAGFFAAPMLGAYSASKFAVRALTEALHHDLRQVDACVQVSLLAPGAVRTGIFDADRNRPPGTPPLAGAGGVVRDQMRAGTAATGMDADAVAALVLEAVRAGRFWIFPHPEMLAPLPELAAAVSAGRTPEFGLAASWKLAAE